MSEKFWVPYQLPANIFEQKLPSNAFLVPVHLENNAVSNLGYADLGVITQVLQSIYQQPIT